MQREHGGRRAVIPPSDAQPPARSSTRRGFRGSSRGGGGGTESPYHEEGRPERGRSGRGQRRRRTPERTQQSPQPDGHQVVIVSEAEADRFDQISKHVASCVEILRSTPELNRGDRTRDMEVLLLRDLRAALPPDAVNSMRQIGFRYRDQKLSGPFVADSILLIWNGDPVPSTPEREESSRLVKDFLIANSSQAVRSSILRLTDEGRRLLLLLASCPTQNIREFHSLLCVATKWVSETGLAVANFRTSQRPIVDPNGFFVAAFDFGSDGLRREECMEGRTTRGVRDTAPMGGFIGALQTTIDAYRRQFRLDCDSSLVELPAAVVKRIDGYDDLNLGTLSHLVTDLADIIPAKLLEEFYSLRPQFYRLARGSASEHSANEKWSDICAHILNKLTTEQLTILMAYTSASAERRPRALALQEFPALDGRPQGASAPASGWKEAARTRRAAGKLPAEADFPSLRCATTRSRWGGDPPPEPVPPREWRPPAASRSQDAAADRGAWTCSRCSFGNPALTLSCALCGDRSGHFPDLKAPR
eukprot:Polyplicarium_translucidae@DN2477_c0_g1_i1.p1